MKSDLRKLARAYGVQSSYTDTADQRRNAPAEALLAVLRRLGAPVETAADAADALRERNREHWRRVLDPVVVVDEGRPVRPLLRLPRRVGVSHIRCRIDPENGEPRERSVAVGQLRTGRTAVVDGQAYVEVTLELPGDWPRGYHRLCVEVGDSSFEALVVIAPSRAYGAVRPGSWGVFAPLYALHGEAGRGVGHYGDLGTLTNWTADLGGDVVGTLPLLASSLERTGDPSPYLPDSRRLWNEFHIDVEKVPEFETSADARALLESPRSRRRRSRLRSKPEVDYPRQAAWQRQIIEALASTFFAAEGRRRMELRRFLRSHPHAEAYARFRAVGEQRGQAWTDWPERLRRGRLRRGDYDPATARRHAYAQWIASEQLDALALSAELRNVRLYLDLPLGVDPRGFDVWRDAALFVGGTTVGAPPDEFFRTGQDWSFPPLHPDRARDGGHAYFAACLRHHMRVAGMLRIDHVMGLHRLFWIPEGCGPAEGVYVRYPASELYAIIRLESHRNRCIVVGEDLGTVPRTVRPAMRRNGLRRTFVMQFAGGPDPRRPLAGLAVSGVAALNTHDLPPFAAFWRGLNVTLRKAWLRDLRRAGFLERGDRVATHRAFRACLAFLAESRAEVVLVALEDLWSETRAQNVPGTTTERRNWSGRMRYPLEQLMKMPRVVRALRELHRRRGGNASRRGRS